MLGHYKQNTNIFYIDYATYNERLIFHIDLSYYINKSTSQ